MTKKVVYFVALMSLMACSGVRTSDKAYSAHAENFNILFLQIPGGNTQMRAMELVPEGSVKTIQSTPTDTTSLLGVINRIIGVDATFINGTVGKE